MKFSEWLKANRERGVEDVDMLAATILPSETERKRWDRAETAEDAIRLAREAWGANDEVVEAVGSVFSAYLAEVGDGTAPADDPMGLPYVPGARTTLADARLQLVCAALAGDAAVGITGVEIATSALTVADAALHAMRG